MMEKLKIIKEENQCVNCKKNVQVLKIVWKLMLVDALVNVRVHVIVDFLESIGQIMKFPRVIVWGKEEEVVGINKLVGYDIDY